MNAEAEKLEFRRGGRADFDGLIALNQHTYGETIWTNRRYFDWHYHEGPDGPAIVYVATAGGRIVGCYLLTLHTFSVFGQTQLAALSVGTIVHEEYTRHLSRVGGRLRTVFAQLADMAYEECAQRDIAVTFAFPNEKSYPTFIQHLGYRDLGTLPFFAKAVRPGRAVAGRLGLPGALVCGVGAVLDVPLRLMSRISSARTRDGVEIEETARADERFDRLWERCQPLAGVVRRRDRAYVQWRFFDHPCLPYRVWLALERGAPAAYLATTIADQKDRAHGTSYRLGHIVDFLCAPHERAGEILSELIRHACREMQRERIEFIIASHNGSDAGREALRRAGLHAFSAKRAPRKWPCLVRVNRPDMVPEGSGIYQVDQWYLNLSDNDLVEAMSEIGDTFDVLSRWLGRERGPQAAREILQRLIATNPALAREVVLGELRRGDGGRIGPTNAAALVRALIPISRQQADEAYQPAAKLWPNDPDVRCAGAALLLASEDWAGALAQADEVLSRHPRRVESLRVAAEALTELGQSGAALERYAELLRADVSSDALNSVVAGLDRIEGNAGASAELPRYWSIARVAIVGNVTTNFLVSHLRALALLEKIHAQVWAGGFDQYRQEILDSASELYAFDPKVLLLVLDWRELVPALYGASLATDPASVRADIDREVAELANLLANFRAHSSASVLVTGPVPPGHTPLGFLDAGHARGLAGYAAYLDERLVEALRQVDGVYVQQTDRVLGWAGQGPSLSDKLRYLARMPYAPAGLRALAADMASLVRQALGKAKKCLVLDLDNTLWGGIIGEDGLEGIKLGPDGVGRAFLDFQREILRLLQQGTILAICSKNNETDVQEVFAQHPHMLLKNEHFAALRVNWVDKPTNLRELADEISIGLDAMVFLDDNPVERDAIRQLVPEVFVPDLPADPVEYPAFLRSLTCFQSLQLTEEDMQRGRFYADDRRRKELREQAGGLEGYLTALGMVVNIRPLDEFTQPRIVQLINRTNQFNLTTRRYGEVDIGQMIGAGDTHVFSLQLEDRYGDNGIVGVAILKLPQGGRDRVGVIDSLLMSCRILGRNVERVFLGFLCDFAAERGVTAVIGEFTPTAKNKQVAEFYPRNGFEPLPAEGTTQRWRRATAQRIERPSYIDVRIAASGGEGASDGR